MSDGTTTATAVPTWTVSAVIYCEPSTVFEEEQKLLNILKEEGWKVYRSDVTQAQTHFLGYAVGNVGGADSNTWVLQIGKPGSRQTDAEQDVTNALYTTGNWSIAAKAASAVASVWGTAKHAARVVTGEEPTSPDSPLKRGISLLELGIGAVVILGVLRYASGVIPRRRA